MKKRTKQPKLPKKIGKWKVKANDVFGVIYFDRGVDWPGV